MIRLDDSHIASGSFGSNGKLSILNWKVGNVVKKVIAGNCGFHSLLRIDDKRII